MGTYFCPPGSVPIPNTDSFGNPILDDFGSPTYTCVYTGGGSSPPLPVTNPVPPPGWTPSGPPAPNKPTTQPSPSRPILPRQPGAPAAPYNPPGRIGLWPGPIFNPIGGASSFGSSSSSSSIGGATVGEGPIFVNVANTTNLADNSASNAVQSVAEAVQSAIGAAVSQANQVAFQTQSDITTAIDAQSSLISGAVDTVFTSLLNGLRDLNTSVSGALGDIGTTIGTDLVNQLNPVTTTLEVLVSIIAGSVAKLPSAIADSVAGIVAEIARVIGNPIGAVKDVLTTIESDISHNLESLVKIPGAIADASTSLDASLQRTLGSYETWNEKFVESQTGWGKADTAHSDLSKLAEALGGLLKTGISPTGVKLADYLDPLCGSTRFVKDLNDVYSAGESPFEWIGHLMSGVAKLIFFLAKGRPAIAKFFDLAGKEIDSKCPSDLLAPDALIDAVRRGYITYDNANAEAAQGNLGDSRFKTLFDLSTHQMTADQLVEALYRGIISQQDYESALQQQGWTASQQELLKSLGVQLLTVSEALELLRRTTIDGPALDAILKSHQYDDAQRKALASLAFRPANMSEATSGSTSLDAFDQLGLRSTPEVYNVPEFIERAAASEGLDHDSTVNRWLTHWNIGTLGNWVELFFRNQISLETLQAIGEREFIPSAILTTLVESQRPLVQFRTISAMARANLIHDDQAAALLRQHGYSDENIKILLAYAHRPGVTPAAKNAQALHSVSLGIAKEEYIDGSITGDQYLAILTQHGYTIDGANTELQVVNAHQALLRRKEQAQLVIDEFGAGLIDERAALAQLAVLGLTVDELARAAHRIRAFRAKTAKHPSEPDLHQFLNHGIITSDDYVAELQAQGYSNKWAKSFLAWRTATPSSTGAGSPQTSPAQGG